VPGAAWPGCRGAGGCEAEEPCLRAWGLVPRGGSAEDIGPPKIKSLKDEGILGGMLRD